MAISLESISRSSGIKAPRIVVYGPAGVGKTTLGCGAPNPIFIQTEDGLGKLEVDAFPMMTSFQDVLDALSALYTSEHQYQTVIIDSLDHLEPLVWQHLCDHYIGPKGERYQSVEDFGYGLTLDHISPALNCRAICQVFTRSCNFAQPSHTTNQPGCPVCFESPQPPSRAIV
ncbi:AAA family ATPase [Endozoicomonas sp. SCSIO W0465]|uniref:AAA family ATPase n=1 Tax=Endozoicomonas sp. SCSIO W0465 TaxID=2918516 RepID=UPI002074B82E|nr:AAA family ATPase [Endozoicomonas sp. SCSIO W0465]USE34113.1 ATP-binding protein [Endozoicomonas sp. SCSIO W0465]